MYWLISCVTSGRCTPIWIHKSKKNTEWGWVKEKSSTVTIVLARVLHLLCIRIHHGEPQLSWIGGSKHLQQDSQTIAQKAQLKPWAPKANSWYGANFRTLASDFQVWWSHAKQKKTSLNWIDFVAGVPKMNINCVVSADKSHNASLVLGTEKYEQRPKQRFPSCAWTSGAMKMAKSSWEDIKEDLCQKVTCSKLCLSKDFSQRNLPSY